MMASCLVSTVLPVTMACEMGAVQSNRVVREEEKMERRADPITED